MEIGNGIFISPNRLLALLDGVRATKGKTGLRCSRGPGQTDDRRWATHARVACKRWKGSDRGRAGNCAVDPFPPDEIKEEETGHSIGNGGAGRTRVSTARYSVCVSGKRRSATRRGAPPSRERRLQHLSLSEPPAQSQAGQKRPRDRPRRTLPARTRGIGDHRESRMVSNGAS
jgi:hypothetical protein